MASLDHRHWLPPTSTSRGCGQDCISGRVCLNCFLSFSKVTIELKMSVCLSKNTQAHLSLCLTIDLSGTYPPSSQLAIMPIGQEQNYIQTSFVCLLFIQGQDCPIVLLLTYICFAFMCGFRYHPITMHRSFLEMLSHLKILTYRDSELMVT